MHSSTLFVAGFSLPPAPGWTGFSILTRGGRNLSFTVAGFAHFLQLRCVPIFYVHQGFVAGLFLFGASVGLVFPAFYASRSTTVTIWITSDGSGTP